MERSFNTLKEGSKLAEEWEAQRDQEILELRKKRDLLRPDVESMIKRIEEELDMSEDMLEAFGPLADEYKAEMTAEKEQLEVDARRWDDSTPSQTLH